MDSAALWRNYFIEVERLALEAIQKLLDDYEAPLNNWVNGMLAGPLPADWRDELARFVAWTYDFGLEFTDESLAEITQILQDHADAAGVVQSTEGDLGQYLSESWRQLLAPADDSTEHVDIWSGTPGGMPAVDLGMSNAAFQNRQSSPQNLDAQHQICFAAGTLVATNSGLKRIELVEDGDLALAVPEDDPHAPHELRAVVKAYHNPPRPLLNAHLGDVMIRATFNHPFWVENRGWTPAGELRIGDLLRASTSSLVPVSGVFNNGEVEPVFNLQVAQHHTYFVGDGRLMVLAHNQSPSNGSKSATDPSGIPESVEQRAAWARRKLEAERKEQAAAAAAAGALKGQPAIENPEALLPRDKKVKAKWIDDLSQAERKDFEAMVAMPKGSVIGALDLNKPQSLAASLYLSIQVSDGKLVITARRGVGIKQQGASLEEILAGSNSTKVYGSADRDSTQVAIKCGPDAILDSNAISDAVEQEKSDIAAKWSPKAGLSPGKRPQNYAAASTDFQIPRGAKEVKVVVVYTDNINGLKDLATVIAAWNGKLVNGSWEFAIDRNDIVRLPGEGILDEEPIDRINKTTKNVLNDMGFDIKARRGPAAGNTGFDITQTRAN